jgi:hypothetical protein
MVILLVCVVFFGWGNSGMVSKIKAGNTLDSILNPVACWSLRVGSGCHIGDFAKALAGYRSPNWGAAPVLCDTKRNLSATSHKGSYLRRPHLKGISTSA